MDLAFTYFIFILFLFSVFPFILFLVFIFTIFYFELKQKCHYITAIQVTKHDGSMIHVTITSHMII